MTVFGDAAAVSRYADGPPRAVPGWASLIPMVDILLAERVPVDGRLLVVGAGGGLELEGLGRRHAGWRFDGVDPSGPMLALAAARVAELGDRVHLHEGIVDDAPEGPFDGATCLLTFHFIPIEQRVPTAVAVHKRLRPGAPFVVAHLSIEDGRAGERSEWLSRYLAFQAFNGADPARAAAAREKVQRELAILSPTQDEAVLRAAGFTGVTQFFMGFAFRGWVAYAS